MNEKPDAESSPIAFLLEIFRAQSHQPAFIYGDETYSYLWLNARVEHWLAELANKGISAGSVVAVTGDYSPEICALFLSLIQRKAVVVPFASVTGQEKEELSEIGNVGFEFGFENGKFTAFTEYRRPVSNELILSCTSRNVPSLIVFSSGSTGRPKGILHDFRPILDKFRVRRKTLRTLTFLQIDHMGGINTLLYILSNGGTVISVPTRSASVVCEAVARYRIELLPVTPSFLNLLIVSGEYKQHDLSSLKIITYGTEVMPEFTLRRVKDIFPNVLVQQTYGLSELGVLRTKSRGDGSLWVRIGGEGYETKVVDNTLWIKAHSAMIGYLNAPQPFDSEGWFNTEDEVEVDGEYFKILGRKSEIINVGGQKVFPSEIENVLIEMHNVEDVVVGGEKNLLMNNIVTARLKLFEDEDPDQLKKRLRAFCRGRLSGYKIPMKIEIVKDELVNSRFKKIRNRPD